MPERHSFALRPGSTLALLDQLAGQGFGPGLRPLGTAAQLRRQVIRPAIRMTGWTTCSAIWTEIGALRH
jgi:hypothetical protein